MAINIGAHTDVQTTVGATTAVTPTITTQASGSTLFAFMAWPNAATFVSFADSKGNTWTQVQSEVVSAGGTRTRAYYCENATGGTLHTCTLTVSGIEVIYLAFVEITGAATASFDIAPAGLDDNSSPFTSNLTGTLAQAAELVVVGVATATPSGTETITWGNSFTQADAKGDSNFVTGGTAYRIVSATTSIQSSITSNVATGALSFIAAFKEAAGVAVTRQALTLLGVS